MRDFGQRLTILCYRKQDVTITETLIVCLGMEEEEEVDSQTMGADLQGQVCEPQPAELWERCHNSKYRLNSTSCCGGSRLEVQQRVHPRGYITL